MSSSHTMRVRRTSAALVLLGIAVAGCSGQTDAEKTVDDARNFMSNAKTCAELVELSVSKLDDVQKHLNDRAKLEQTIRESAAEFEAKAAEVDDAQLKRAINSYVTKMQRVADRAEHNQEIDLGAIRDANGALADACS